MRAHSLVAGTFDLLINVHDLSVIHLVPKDTGREKDEAWIVEQASLLILNQVLMLI